MGVLDSPHSPGIGVGHWRDRLEHCPGCKCDLVQPVSYEPLWGDRWLVSLECPSCAWNHEGVWPHAALRRFEEHLDEVDDQLWDQLLAIERARMEGEIELFAGALHADAILPEDF
jgi:hypothetical protein